MNQTGSSEYPKKNKKVLIVDDDRDTRDIYSEFLTEASIEVFLAVDGEEGLAKIITDRYDLVILDIMMPKMDGLEILKKIKELPDGSIAKDTTIVVLSALDQPKVIDEAMSLGAKGFLSKSSLTPDQALEKIKEYLN